MLSSLTTMGFQFMRRNIVIRLQPYLCCYNMKVFSSEKLRELFKKWSDIVHTKLRFILRTVAI